MNHRVRVGLYLLCLSLAMFGCARTGQQDEAPDVGMTLLLDPDPPLLGRPCQMILTLSEVDNQPIESAELTIEGDMTHAGMVPVVEEISGGSDGIYRTDFEWSMAGDWILTVTAELPDGRTVRRTFELTVELPGG